MAYSYRLTDSEKRELLRIARTSLREFLRSGRIPPGKPHRPSMTAAAGAFVTLHRHDRLRGCIGTQRERLPLYRTVQEMVVAAATRDPRFPPVTLAELDELDIEISVLGGRFPVRGPADIAVGTHGVAVELEGRRGLLLPQVAVEHNLAPADFLAQVCAKAGLPADSWGRADASVEGFTAQVFGEAHMASEETAPLS